MAKKTGTDVNADHPTHTTDFFASDVDKVRFYEDPMIDNIVTAILALGTETWSNRRRTLVLERLLEEKGVSQEMVESYMPTDVDIAEWKAERDRMVEMVMGPLMRKGNLHPSTPRRDGD